jgi:hypothetical protein
VHSGGFMKTCSSHKASLIRFRVKATLKGVYRESSIMCGTSYYHIDRPYILKLLYCYERREGSSEE